MESSLTPRWLCRTLRDRSRSTTPAPATTASPRAARRTASRSMPNSRFSVVAIPALRNGQTLRRTSRRPRRRVLAHRDLARDRAALGRRVVAREPGLTRPGDRLGDLDEPEIRRPALPVARRGCDAAIGCDQRELARERLLGGDDDAQGCAPPGRHRRGQDRKLGGVLVQLPSGACARDSRSRPGRREHAPATSGDAGTAAANVACSNRTDSLSRKCCPDAPERKITQYYRRLWLNDGRIPHQVNSTGDRFRLGSRPIRLGPSA